VHLGVEGEKGVCHLDIAEGILEIHQTGGKGEGSKGKVGRGKGQTSGSWAKGFTISKRDDRNSFCTQVRK